MEDNPDDFELIGLALDRADARHRYELDRVDDATGFANALGQDYDAILCDFNLPRFSPYAALQILVARRCSTPLVVVTRAIGEEAAVHVLRCGAKDYVAKDKLGTMPQIIERVMAERQRALEQERLGRELQDAYRRLKTLSARLVVAQERERSRISRELHDQLGQGLTGMVIHLHAAQRTDDPANARAHTETAMEMAQDAVAQLKTLSFALRPAQLDLLGLVAAAKSAVQRIAEPAGLACRVVSRGAEPAVPGETASVALRLVQEALTNIVRHAHASRIELRLRFLPEGRIGVLMVDDGVGFDKSGLLVRPAGRPARRAQSGAVRDDRAHRTGRRQTVHSNPTRAGGGHPCNPLNLSPILSPITQGCHRR